MDRKERERTRILYVETNEISLLDIPRALDTLGYDVYRGSMGIHAQGFRVNESRKIAAAIDKWHIHYVISYDFAESIAQACFETGIPYISWIYDAPQKELYTHYALYPGNYIFVFDKGQRERLLEIGIKNVFHVPLAILPEKIACSLQNVKQEYRADISFVGQLYDVSPTERLIQSADETIQKQVQECVDACLLKWDEETHLHGKLGEESVSFFSQMDTNDPQKKYPYITEQFYYEAAVISRMLANRERIAILNTLAEEYNVDFYTKEKDLSKISSKVHVMPPVEYDTEISAIYYQTKININVTLHCIETGASQRIFDVMAAGGFLISNYQQELEELFVPGDEIVLFHNMDELLELVHYYMEHEEERKRIAENGKRKVLALHNYAERLDQIIDLVENKEQSRTESFIALQRRFLSDKANECLVKHEVFAIQELYDTFTNKIHETTIQKTTDLGVLRELLECWKYEMDLGKPCAFDDVSDLKQVVHKYDLIKHGLWRIEQQLSMEKCLDGLQYMLNESVSMIMLGWIIYSNMKNRENVYLWVADYIKQIDIMKALELITYGLMLMGDNDTLFIAKADILLDMSLWKDALQALKKVRTPSEGILEIITELESV